MKKLMELCQLWQQGYDELKTIQKVPLIPFFNADGTIRGLYAEIDYEALYDNVMKQQHTHLKTKAWTWVYFYGVFYQNQPITFDGQKLQICDYQPHVPYRKFPQEFQYSPRYIWMIQDKSLIEKLKDKREVEIKVLTLQHFRLHHAMVSMTLIEKEERLIKKLENELEDAPVETAEENANECKI